MSVPRPLAAEFAGTAGLLLAVVGSGAMAEALSGGNAAVALLANSLATAAALVVLITLLAPVSGAHLNPAVTLMAWVAGDLPLARVPGYILAQMAGGAAGVLAVQAMFGLPVLQLSTKARGSPGLWLSEALGTVILLAVIRGSRGGDPLRVGCLVALTVLAGYWATASTFFANPAATLARSLSDTFAGIRPADAPGFLLAQAAGLVLVLAWVRVRR